MSNLYKRQVYLGLLEIVSDSKYYYNSGVSLDYNRLTEEGREEIIHWIELMAPKMIALQKQELDNYAKSMIIGELKK